MAEGEDAASRLDASVFVLYIQNKENKVTPAMTEFVDVWGQMGTIWGITASVARVHALLLASEQALTLDEICVALSIAKSNASTSLKELRDWGVVRRSTVPGERKERYASEGDPWLMLFNIARERKRREFDPALSAVRKAVSAAGKPSSGMAGGRLRKLEEMFSAMNAVATKALENEATARALLGFLGAR